jgi:hypothetical protein
VVSFVKDAGGDCVEVGFVGLDGVSGAETSEEDDVGVVGFDDGNTNDNFSFASFASANDADGVVAFDLFDDGFGEREAIDASEGFVNACDGGGGVVSGQVTDEHNEAVRVVKLERVGIFSSNGPTSADIDVLAGAGDGFLFGEGRASDEGEEERASHHEESDVFHGIKPYASLRRRG